MKNSFLKIVLPAIGLLLLLSSQGLAWTGVVQRVVDGDTIKVRHNTALVNIRLYGLDAPERAQKGGKQATLFVEQLLGPGDLIQVEQTGVGPYQRPIGIVVIQSTGLSLNEALVENGHAWVYSRYCKKNFCRKWVQLEDEARKGRVGLWAEPDPIPPWVFRKQHKN